MSNIALYQEHAAENAGGEHIAPAGYQPVGNLSTVIKRVEETIETETQALRNDPAFDLKASNARKSRNLYELNKIMRSVRREEMTESQRAGLQRLREKLETNETVLRAHLGAVSEVAGLLEGAIKRSEADGTYGAYDFGGSGAP